MRRRQCLLWVTAAMTLAVLLLPAWQCVDLYVSGSSPANLDEKGIPVRPVFTMDRAAELLHAFLPVLAVYALLVLFSLIAQRGSVDAAPVGLTPENRLRLMKSRVTILPAAAEAEEKRRRRICLLSGAAVLICAIPVLIYLLDRANFTDWDLESVMGRMVLHVAPFIFAAFGAAAAASIACGRSAKRECALLRGTPLSHPRPTVPSRSCPVSALRIVLAAAAVLFIVLGVMNGGMWDVLVKAVNICTECIGLG